MRSRLIGGAAVFLLLTAGGCAYSFSSGLPSHVKSVAIPLFANETSEFDIAEEVTNGLIAAFVRDNTLRVVSDESEATSVVFGTIRTYAEEPRGYTREEQVEQFQIQIVVDVRFVDRVSEEVLWESSRVFGSAVYGNTGPDARAAGLEQAIKQVVDEILSGVVAGW